MGVKESSVNFVCSVQKQYFLSYFLPITVVADSFYGKFSELDCTRCNLRDCELVAT